MSHPVRWQLLQPGAPSCWPPLASHRRESDEKHANSNSTRVELLPAGVMAKLLLAAALLAAGASVDAFTGAPLRTSATSSTTTCALRMAVASSEDGEPAYPTTRAYRALRGCGQLGHCTAAGAWLLQAGVHCRGSCFAFCSLDNVDHAQLARRVDA
jgi:hypothetical protein